MRRSPHDTDDGRAVAAARTFLQELMAHYRGCPFAVRFWEGSLWNPTPDQEPRFTLVLRHPGTLRRMFLPANDLTLGEAYIFDDFDIEGDIVEAFSLANYLSTLSLPVAEKFRKALYLFRLPFSDRCDASPRAARFKGGVHSKKRDAKAVGYHYNVSNDFFRLWLDRRMIYSCAYFKSLDDSLDTAQEQKLDHICRKLRLRQGERLLDIGCGWGGLIIHAARRYGVQAVGITLSQPQAELAEERIREAGLAEHCRVEVRDYRDVDESHGFDKLVSVGMFEHVGESRVGEYFAKAWRLLRPGGVFLNHGIAVSLARPFPKGPSFIARYVFPDGELLPVATTLRTAESSGFEVRDLESLREHYTMTLCRWVSRLEQHHEEARRVVDEVTYRIWRLYMAGSAYGFRTGRLNVYQALLAKPVDGDSLLPLTRTDWYA